MRSLVTGSSGLLGGCLIRRLEERGHDLRLIDIEPPATPVSHEFVRADVSEPTAFDAAARGVDVIYHLAAAQRMKPQFSSWSEEMIFDRNVAGLRNAIEAAERHDVPKLVFVSSSGVYGIPRTVPCREDHPRVPLGAYGRSKVLAEDLCRAAIDRGLNVTALRPMSLFGPGMTGVFILLFEWIRIGAPVYLLGSGRNRVQFASAWDVAEACILAAERPSSHGEIVNVGADPETVTPVIEVVRALIDHAGSESRVVPIPTFLLRNAARVLRVVGMSPIQPEHYLLADSNFVLDIDAARVSLGFQPRRSNTEVMIDAYDWYVGAGDGARPQFHPIVRLLNRLAPQPR